MLLLGSLASEQQGLWYCHSAQHCSAQHSAVASATRDNLIKDWCPPDLQRQKRQMAAIHVLLYSIKGYTFLVPFTVPPRVKRTNPCGHPEPLGYGSATPDPHPPFSPVLRIARCLRRCSWKLVQQGAGSPMLTWYSEGTACALRDA